MSTAPTRSVVLASTAGMGELEAALAVLAPACRDMVVELIVVRGESADGLGSMPHAFPSVRFVLAPRDAPAADLKSLGAGQSTADIVVITDEHAAAQENWAESLLRGSAVLSPGSRDGKSSHWIDTLMAFDIREPGRAG